MTTTKEFRDLAIKLVGKRYILGHPSPWNTKSPKGYDCSGMCCWLFWKIGQAIGDTTAAGLYNRTSAVTSPKVGDMVFLRNNSARSNGIGHVAIITAKLSSGDWEIVEARGSKYGVVRTSLSSWKKRAKYAGIRRLKSLKLSAPSTSAPAAKPTPKPSVVLGQGARGSRVRTLQRGLLAVFPAYAGRIRKTGGADGIYGPGTADVVAEFQKRSGLKVTGNVDTATQKALAKYSIKV